MIRRILLLLVVVGSCLQLLLHSNWIFSNQNVENVADPAPRYNFESVPTYSPESDRAIVTLLNNYMREHSVETVKVSTYMIHAVSSYFSCYSSSHFHHEQRKIMLHSKGKHCNHKNKYLVGTFSAPKQLGNRIHEFLNAFLAAVIMDRTLLWHYCTQRYCHYKHTEGNGTLQLATFIPSASEILPILVKEGCLSSKLGHVDRLHALIHDNNRTRAESQLACCGLENLNSTVLKLGRLERHELVALSKSGSLLTRAALERARILFSNGEDLAYGHAFKACFKFSPYLVEWNQNHLKLKSKYADTLSNSKKVSSSWVTKITSYLTQISNDMRSKQRVIDGDFKVGLHVRHMNPRDNGKEDKGEEECLRQVLEWYKPEGATCTVYLASDREMTINRLAAYIDMKGCHTVIARREQHRHIRSKPSTNIEHGPWGDGLNAVADVELLSRADHFIGSAENYGEYPLSTYSMLIASLVAMNGLNREYIKRVRVMDDFALFDVFQARRRQRRKLQADWDMLDAKSDAFHAPNIHWLPYCSKAYGSYIESQGSPTKMFADKAFTWDCAGNSTNSYEVWVPPRCKGGKHQHLPSRPILTTRRDCLNKVNCLDDPFLQDTKGRQRTKNHDKLLIEDILGTIDVDIGDFGANAVDTNVILRGEE